MPDTIQSTAPAQDKRSLITYTVGDLQQEAIDRIGRTLTEDEIDIARSAFSHGMWYPIDITVDTIFTEMI